MRKTDSEVRKNFDQSCRGTRVDLRGILNQLLFGGPSPFGGLRAGPSTNELVISEAEGEQALRQTQDKLTDMRLKLG
jgi:hypothetical protein